MQNAQTPFSICEPKTRKQIAYHEGGHAVAVLALGGSCSCVSIKKSDSEGGRVICAGAIYAQRLVAIGGKLRLATEEEQLACAEHEAGQIEIAVALAGQVAEDILGGVRPHPYDFSVEPWTDDGYTVDYAITLRHAASLAKSKAGEFGDILRGWACAWLILERDWRAVRRIASALLDHEEIDGESAADIYRRALVGVRPESQEYHEKLVAQLLDPSWRHKPETLEPAALDAPGNYAMWLAQRLQPALIPILEDRRYHPLSELLHLVEPQIPPETAAEVFQAVVFEREPPIAWFEKLEEGRLALVRLALGDLGCTEAVDPYAGAYYRLPGLPVS